ncbi:hypothetical protein [Demequina capsici]|uniref:Uncharacterized protein n=1 Tax=Demequina capsici TaxID=3075620 RepID=A0AA96FC06_9MICO|nr:hypothetical protein [Demequina sp. OYTSA14]WNM25520.1 hypothetical protein RN606_05065 [Demequina sp. OYTSA14]
MELYSGIVYPTVLIVAAVLVAVGVVTLLASGAHRVLKVAVSVAWVATAIQAIGVIAALVNGVPAGIVITVGYLLASVALLPLLGIGRLGEPPAPGEPVDPDRPVLRPDQIVRLDAIAAVVIGLAIAVVAWRLDMILEAA